MDLAKLDGISERVLGWGCIAATVTEYINPALLSIDLSQASGLGIFGFLVATGRANAAVKRIGQVLAGG